MKAGWIAGVLCVPVLTVSLWAHHTASREFDTATTITLKGAITKLEWKNPHVSFHVAVMGPEGKPVDWRVETSPPHILQSSGIDKSVFPIGTQVTVEAFPARNDPRRAGGQTITLPGGRKVDIRDKALPINSVSLRGVPVR